MDPITAAALIGGGVQAISGLIGYLVQSGKQAEAQAILAKATDEYGNIDPALFKDAVAETLPPSELTRIQADPRLREAQFNALEKMRQIEEGGGFNAADRANLARVRAQTARDTSGRGAAIRQEMQQRGVGGSGAELAMRQMAAQNEANTRAQQDLDIAAQAQQRYFDAVRNRAGMAGGIRSQEYGEAAAAARAQDEIARFNNQNRLAVQQYNNSLRQQEFGNRLGLADRRYGAQRELAGQIAGTGDRLGQVVGGVGNAIGQGIQEYGASQYAQRRQPQVHGNAAPPTAFGEPTTAGAFNADDDFDTSDYYARRRKARGY